MYERAEFVDTRGKKIRICIEILSCFLNATPNIFHSITNATYSMDYFRATKLSNIESTCYYSRKKKRERSDFEFLSLPTPFRLSRVSNTSISTNVLRILHPFLPVIPSKIRKFPRLCYSCKLVTRPSTRSIPSGRWWKDGSRLL